jgi:hypothetical protein
VYTDQARRLDDSIDEMLAAAGLSVPRERLFSFLGALRGGRRDEVRPRVELMLDTDASTVDRLIHWNDISRNEGHAAFNERFNEGHKPQSVITSPAFPSPPLPYVTAALSFLLPVALLGSILLSVRKRQWLLGVVFVAPTLLYSAAMAWLLADNARFLMTTSIYSVAGLCALWAANDRRIGSRYRLDQHYVVDDT